MLVLSFFRITGNRRVILSAHSTPSDLQREPPRKRTSAQRQRKDKYSAPVRKAGVTLRTLEGRLIRDVRADLIKHVGGTPSVTQRVLIERAVMLTVQLGRMDAKALADGAMSEHASREYLAWSNTLTRTMKALGIKGASERTPSLKEFLAARSAA
jgi:hypothetical protein